MRIPGCGYSGLTLPTFPEPVADVQLNILWTFVLFPRPQIHIIYQLYNNHPRSASLPLHEQNQIKPKLSPLKSACSAQELELTERHTSGLCLPSGSD